MDGSSYISVILGVLFSASEILPYIKNLKGNGIIDTIHRAIIYNSNLENTETQPLLNSSPQSQPQSNSPQSNSPQSIVNIDTSDLVDQLKLLNKPLEFESLDKYEMIYIINYIKTNFDKKHLFIPSLSIENKNALELLRYNIDFDSNKDLYKIHW